MPPNITSLGNSDPLSDRLRTFSQQLTSISLEDIVISSELFWPTNSDSVQFPHWPHLTSFELVFQPITPSGNWLFDRDPMAEVYSGDESRDLSLYFGDDEIPAREDWKADYFRIKPIEHLMNDFYLAAGHAVAEMPRLKVMRLEAVSSGNHGLEYKATASTANLELWDMPRYYCEELWDRPPFQFSKDVLKVWMDAARRNTGAELEAKFVSETQIFLAKGWW